MSLFLFPLIFLVTVTLTPVSLIGLLQLGNENASIFLVLFKFSGIFLFNW